MYDITYIVNNFSQRSISTSSSFHRTENGYDEYDQNRASIENRSQSSMSLDSLIRPGQIVAEDKYTNNVDVETPMDVTETEIGENKERRHKAYDTMSIADSTLGL